VLRKLCLLAWVAFACSPLGYPKKDLSYVPPVPLTPEQFALVQKAIAQEKMVVKVLRQQTPLVQTYIQNMRSDPKLQWVPESDQYALGRVDFARVIRSSNEYETGLSTHGFFQGSLDYIKELTKALNINGWPLGFMGMMFVDPVNLDQEHYDFSYVRRDFLGGVRTVVFDVRPKPNEAYGRFFGRVWIEDQEGNIVRFNGSYTGGPPYYHFDSWRVNVRPNVWLPTAIYVEENPSTIAKQAPGMHAQTYFWGYSLKLPTPDNDSSASRPRASQADANVLDRLTQAGLLAPPSDFDKVLETVTNNIIIGSKLNLPYDVHCRVLLTAPLESLSIGNTILISKGLADVLPTEEALAAVLSYQVAHIVMGHGIDTRYAFNDALLFPDDAGFQRYKMNHSAADNVEAARKAAELFNASVYNNRRASVGLFFQALEMQEKEIPFLLTPQLGDSLVKADGTPWLAELGQGAPELNLDDLRQVAALPLNSRLKIDPWDDTVRQLNVIPAPLLSARDKMPFQVAPIYYRLERYQSSTSESKLTTSTAITPNESIAARNEVFTFPTLGKPSPSAFQPSTVNSLSPGASHPSTSDNSPHGASQASTVSNPSPGASQPSTSNSPFPGASEPPTVNNPSPGVSEPPTVNSPSRGASEPPAVNSPSTATSQPSVPFSTGDTQVDQALRRLPNGTLGYNSPEVMKTGHIALVVARVGPEQMAALGLMSGISATPGTKTETVSTPISPKMKMTLTSADFDITPLSSPEQAVGGSSPTTWEWQIKPKHSGKLHLHLAAIVELLDLSKDVTTVDKDIVVRVDFLDEAEQFIEKNWQWIAGTFGTGIATAWGLWRRRRRPKNPTWQIP
jgi:hypothetical protein